MRVKGDEGMSHKAEVITGVGLAIAGNYIYWEFAKDETTAKRIVKYGIYAAIAAGLTKKFGRPHNMFFIAGLPILGAVGHTILMKKDGINPITAEPKEKYYGLRGWERG